MVVLGGKGGSHERSTPVRVSLTGPIAQESGPEPAIRTSSAVHIAFYIHLRRAQYKI